MSRPKSKDELLAMSGKNYRQLIDFVDALSDDEKNADFPEGTMNRNIRDVLAHLHHWHGMFLAWYRVGMTDMKPEMPAPGYTWKDTPALNQKIFTDYQSKDLNAVRELLRDSYERVQKIITRHSNDELFEKKRFKWTGTTSMGAYLVSATSSHYEWAFKLIKKAKKN